MSFSQTQATWFLTEALFLVTISLCCAVAFAQTTGEPARGSTPPGMSQDGAKPSDGAIMGGSAGKAGSAATGGTSIAPGETAGMPNRTPADAAEGKQRCDELSGSLREQCLEKEKARDAAPRDPNQVLKKPY